MTFKLNSEIDGQLTWKIEPLNRFGLILWLLFCGRRQSKVTITGEAP